MTELAYRSPLDDGACAGVLNGGRTIAGSGYLGAIVPESPELHRLLGAARDERGAAEDAAARYTRATTLLEAGRFDEAIEQFRLVPRLAPGSVEALNLGVAFASQGKLDEAIDQFHQALAARPGFDDARRHLARARGAAPNR